MDELFSEFLTDTRERLDLAEAALGQPEGLRAAIRQVHTIRGAAGFMDTPRLLALIEAAEIMLIAANARGGMSSGEHATFQRCTERVRGIIAGAEAGAEPAGDDAALREALAAASTSQAQAPHSRYRFSWNDLSAEAAAARDTLTSLAPVAAAEGALTDAIVHTSLAAEHDAQTVRRVPLENICRSLPRMAHQAAGMIGKHVDLQLEGGAITLDAALALEVRAILIHLVRNAVAHGIEAPAERARRGKPEAGAIRIAARRDGDALCIDISDDGAGLDLAAIRKRGVENGMIGAAQAVRLSDVKTLGLMFAPGFTTARHVTTLSGCGIGLDAVKAGVEKLGGRLELESRHGAGLLFRMRLPQTGAAPVITIDPAHRIHEHLRPLLGAAGYEIAEGEVATPAIAEERKEQTA